MSETDSWELGPKMSHPRYQVQMFQRQKCVQGLFFSFTCQQHDRVNNLCPLGRIFFETLCTIVIVKNNKCYRKKLLSTPSFNLFFSWSASFSQAASVSFPQQGQVGIFQLIGIDQYAKKRSLLLKSETSDNLWILKRNLISKVEGNLPDKELWTRKNLKPSHQGVDAWRARWVHDIAGDNGDSNPLFGLGSPTLGFSWGRPWVLPMLNIWINFE